MSLKAIILPTYNRNEKYIDYCINVINALWPSHPEIWVFSDRGKFKYKKFIIVKNPSWVERLNKGIDNLINEKILSVNDYILLLIEDHIPIYPVPGKTIDSLTNYAMEYGIKFVSLHGHGKSTKIKEVDGVDLYKVKEDFEYYSETHPAIWNLKHLINTMHRAMTLRCIDIWKTEKIRIPNIAHYTATKRHTSDSVWPSVFSGFLKSGKVNLITLKKMKHPALRNLKKALIGNWLLSIPQRATKKLKRTIYKKLI